MARNERRWFLSCMRYVLFIYFLKPMKCIFYRYYICIFDTNLFTLNEDLFMSHFNGLGALKAVLIIGTDFRKIDNTLYRY